MILVLGVVLVPRSIIAHGGTPKYLAPAAHPHTEIRVREIVAGNQLRAFPSAICLIVGDDS